MANYNVETHSTLEVRQVEPQPYDTYKVAIQPNIRALPPDQTLPEVWDQDDLPKSTADRTICKLRPRTFWSTVLLVVLAIAAIVGGSVAATVHHSLRPQSVSPMSPAGSVPANTSNVSIPAHILSDTGLASVAWNDTNSITQYRVYYQTENNVIMESAWNSSARLWYISNNAIGKAKNVSPIAATVTGPPDFQLVSYTSM